MFPFISFEYLISMILLLYFSKCLDTSVSISSFLLISEALVVVDEASYQNSYTSLYISDAISKFYLVYPESGLFDVNTSELISSKNTKSLFISSVTILLERGLLNPIQEILDNEYAEIRVDTRIKTDVKIQNNRPDIFILDKKKNKITLIEVGITSQDLLQLVEIEKFRKYDLLANELGLIYKCSIEIIPYVMTWDGIVTKYHKSHLKRLEIPMNVEAYIQSIVLKKTVETISFDRRTGLESGLNAEE
ncbi:hypothetical protein CWI37_0607p0010, partial [Hamiltosporidium tvaerminnensis]